MNRKRDRDWDKETKRAVDSNRKAKRDIDRHTERNKKRESYWEKEKVKNRLESKRVNKSSGKLHYDRNYKESID